MAGDQQHTTATLAHTHQQHDISHERPGVVDPSGPMVLWTWVTFGLMAWVLYKFAWKPILAGLDKRETDIQKSIEDAEEITRKLAEIKGTQDSMIAEADEKAKELVDQSRKAAIEAARVIEKKAKDGSHIILENAQREIKAAQEKAEASLRKESVDLAISLAGKILDENLDTEKQQALANRLIKNL
ncbi:MAG: F0F1 ATP synthase subunit B [Kiritimatiellae bacterium]|nr:F0F1 ATP synthase subunit B [Kiritimatiellia bacterium]